MNPISTQRNPYYLNKKNSSIYTPLGVSKFIFDLINNKIHGKIIIDPAVGSGNLLKYYPNNYILIGYDIYDDKERDKRIKFYHEDFLEMFVFDYSRKDIALVICNPPFNNNTNSKYNRKLLPELFIKHIFNLYGQNIPVVLFTPMGFRLNQREISKRWKDFRDNYKKAEITSIISLPLDIFPDVEFHNEILIWNIQGLKAHYWLPEKYL